MRNVVCRGRDYEAYAVIRQGQRILILTEQTGTEKDIHRPVQIDKLLSGPDVRCLYHDASVEKLVVKPQPFISPYYQGLKWVSYSIYEESDLKILPIANGDSISDLKKEVEIV